MANPLKGTKNGPGLEPNLQHFGFHEVLHLPIPILTRILILALTACCSVGQGQLFCEEILLLNETQVTSPKLTEYLKRNHFPEVSLQAITSLERFGSDHPERTHGYQSKDMLKGKYQGQDVLVKMATLTEIRFANLLSDLQLGPHFYGVIPGGQYYIMQFLPDSLFIKDTYSDNRIMKLKKDGFRLKPDSLTEIQNILRILARLNIEPDDAQFLIQKNGPVKMIDPEFFRITHPKSSEAYRGILERNFEARFKEVQKKLQNE